MTQQIDDVIAETSKDANEEESFEDTTKETAQEGNVPTIKKEHERFVTENFQTMMQFQRARRNWLLEESKRYEKETGEPSLFQRQVGSKIKKVYKETTAKTGYRKVERSKTKDEGVSLKNLPSPLLEVITENDSVDIVKESFTSQSQGKTSWWRCFSPSKKRESENDKYLYKNINKEDSFILKSKIEEEDIEILVSKTEEADPNKEVKLFGKEKTIIKEGQTIARPEDDQFKNVERIQQQDNIADKELPVERVSEFKNSNIEKIPDSSRVTEQSKTNETLKDLPVSNDMLKKEVPETKAKSKRFMSTFARHLIRKKIRGDKARFVASNKSNNDTDSKTDVQEHQNKSVHFD